MLSAAVAAATAARIDIPAKLDKMARLFRTRMHVAHARRTRTRTRASILSRVLSQRAEYYSLFYGAHSSRSSKARSPDGMLICAARNALNI